jgi:hypothetical protein
VEKYLHHLICNLAAAAHALVDSMAFTIHGLLPFVRIRLKCPAVKGPLMLKVSSLSDTIDLSETDKERIETRKRRLSDSLKPGAESNK